MSKFNCENSLNARIEFFTKNIAAICEKTPFYSERPIAYTIITNPASGGFTMAKRWKKHRVQLLAAAEKAAFATERIEKAHPSQTALLSAGNFKHYGCILTKKSKDAAHITDLLIKEARGSGVFQLIVASGGDGTNRDIHAALCTAGGKFVDAPEKNCVVLRLPMGTGNDGAASCELSKALDLLLYPSKIVYQSAVALLSANQARVPFYAFNILSVGLDAFVTHMTNKMKDKMPGDFYKLWVDIASLFYSRIYKVDMMDVRVCGKNDKTIAEFSDKVLLLAVGASGGRTYGSQIHVLPDERNVCVTLEMPLYRKLAIKEKFKNGTHINCKECKMFSAESLTIKGRQKILSQMDGETVCLEISDFPLRIALTKPVSPTLGMQ